MSNKYDIKQRMMRMALEKLNRIKTAKNFNLHGDYEMALSNWSRGLCETCGVNIVVDEFDEKLGDNICTMHVKYRCGHGTHFICENEEIGIWEKNKLELRYGYKGEVSPHRKTIIRTEPGRNPKSVDGVEVRIEIDHENNKFRHTITDIKTKKVLHLDDEQLDKHKSK